MYLFYFLNIFFFQFLLYLCLTIYFFFKLSAESRKEPKLFNQDTSFFFSIFMLLFTFFFFYSSLLSNGQESSLISLSLAKALAALPLFFLFFIFTFLFLSLLNISAFKAQLSSLFLFIFNITFLFFFFMLFSFTNHFELFCLFEYLNSLLVLFILISVPTLKPTLNLLKTPQGYNTKFMSSYFFLPALLNYFFLLFLISICLFYIYLYFLSDLLFLISFNDLKFFQGQTFFATFLLLFLVFKLGVAPLHFWKLEIFESFRFVHFSFFSTTYFFSSLITFQILLLQLPLLSSSTSFLLFTLIITYNLFFVFFHINSVLNLRQFLVLSALLNLNLAFLSLVLNEEGAQPFFLLFVTSYIFLAFTFYFFFVFLGSNPKYFSSLPLTLNQVTRYLFYTFPILSFAGAAPTLAFFFKLIFLLTNLHTETLFIISFYIFTIILSFVFYFQLFKTNADQVLVQPEKACVYSLKANFAVLFVLTLLSILGLTPLFATNLYFLTEGFQTYLTLFFTRS